jgi:hypothetical protein
VTTVKCVRQLVSPAACGFSVRQLICPSADLTAKAIVNREFLKTLHENEEFCLLGYDAVSSVESQSTFRRNMSPPSSGSKNKLSKKPAETSLDFQRTIRRYIPEDRTLRHSKYYNISARSK